MSLDVFFQHDIRNTLVALRAAQSAQPDLAGIVEAPVLREREAYRAGFEMAIRSVALAFGISVEERATGGLYGQAMTGARRMYTDPATARERR